MKKGEEKFLLSRKKKSIQREDASKIVTRNVREDDKKRVESREKSFENKAINCRQVTIFVDFYFLLMSIHNFGTERSKNSKLSLSEIGAVFKSYVSIIWKGIFAINFNGGILDDNLQAINLNYFLRGERNYSFDYIANKNLFL